MWLASQRGYNRTQPAPIVFTTATASQSSVCHHLMARTNQYIQMMANYGQLRWGSGRTMPAEKNEKRQHVSGKRGDATGAVAQKVGEKEQEQKRKRTRRKKSSVLQRETRGTRRRAASNAIRKAAHTNHWRQFRISSALHGVIERAYIKTRSNQISRVTIWPLLLPANS
jgi:hypothetical protein